MGLVSVAKLIFVTNYIYGEKQVLECKTLGLVSVVPRFLTGSHGQSGKTPLVLHKYHSPIPSKLSHRRKVCFATFKEEPVVKTLPIAFVFLLLDTDTDVNVSCYSRP